MCSIEDRDKFKMKEKTFHNYQHRSLDVCTVMLLNCPISNSHFSIYVQYLRWMQYRIQTIRMLIAGGFILQKWSSWAK